MRRLFGCPDIVSLTEKFLMARNFYRIFTENNPVMGDSKTFGIPKAKGLKTTALNGPIRSTEIVFTNKSNMPSKFTEQYHSVSFHTITFAPLQKHNNGP